MYFKPKIFQILDNINIIKNDCNIEVLPPLIENKQYPPISTHTGNPLAYYQRTAKAAYKKYFFGKHTPETERKYLLCWFNDMKSILHQHGITEQQFFNPIK